MSGRLPSFKPRELVALLNRAGFRQVYQDSSHLYLEHSVSRRTTCVPMHTGDLKRGLVHKILLKDCGLTRKEIQKLT